MINSTSSNSFRERFTVTALRDNPAAISDTGKQTNRNPLPSVIPAARVVLSSLAYTIFAVLLTGNRSIATGNGRRVENNGIGSNKFKFHSAGLLLSPRPFGQITRALYHNGPEALLALMLTPPAQFVIGHTPTVIQEKGKLQLSLLAHSRHNVSLT